MSTISADAVSRVFALIAIFIALYNAYLEWFEDKPSFYLSTLVVIFVLLSVFAREYSKKQNC